MMVRQKQRTKKTLLPAGISLRRLVLILLSTYFVVLTFGTVNYCLSSRTENEPFELSMEDAQAGKRSNIHA